MSIADSAQVTLFCSSLRSSDERPFDLLNIVEEELGESLDYVIDSPVPRKLSDRKSYIKGHFRQGATLAHAPKAGTRLPWFSNGNEKWALKILVSGDSGPSGPDSQIQLRIQISFPRLLSGPRGESLLARLGPAMETRWGIISFLDLALITAEQYPNPLEPKAPPDGFPPLTRGQFLDSIARPHQLGWLNYWSDEAAKLAGLEASHDETVVGKVRRIANHGWIVQLTEEPLDVSRPDHRARLSSAYERFQGVGRVTGRKETPV